MSLHQSSCLHDSGLQLHWKKSKNWLLTLNYVSGHRDYRPSRIQQRSTFGINMEGFQGRILECKFGWINRRSRLMLTTAKLNTFFSKRHFSSASPIKAKTQMTTAKWALPASGVWIPTFNVAEVEKEKKVSQLGTMNQKVRYIGLIQTWTLDSLWSHYDLSIKLKLFSYL